MPAVAKLTPKPPALVDSRKQKSITVEIVNGVLPSVATNSFKMGTKWISEEGKECAHIINKRRDPSSSSPPPLTINGAATEYEQVYPTMKVS